MKKTILIKAEKPDNKDETKYIYDIKEGDIFNFVFFIDGGFRYNIDLRFNFLGENSRLNAFIIEKGIEGHDLNLNIVSTHTKKNSHGRIFIRRVMDDYSNSFINGNLVMEKNAGGSSDFFDERTLILGENIVSKVIPSLEINPSDVLVSHLSSLSSIPEDELFYLRSKGVNCDESINLIKEGFLLSILDKISDQMLKREIKKHINE